MNKQKSLSALHIYPIKSCKGLNLTSVSVGPKGPGFDRRWMVIDANGRFISQRQFHKMALIDILQDDNELIIKIPNNPEYRMPIFSSGEQKQVSIWKDTSLGVDQGDEIAHLLSRFLETECRLVFMPDTSFRQVDQKYALRNNDDVGFADGYPFLLISEASLEELNCRLQEPILMDRFRPNLVIKGCEPFEEDTWKFIRIGEIYFQVAKPCSRCIVTTIEQSTGKKGLEPLQTLATYRKQEKGIMFGQNLIHQNNGILQVGDELEVLEE